MRFRIQEYRRCYNGLPNRFIVEFTEAWWPFGAWESYYREEWPRERAQFDSLEQARDFIRAERAKFKARDDYEKATKPIYHKP